MSVLTRLAPCPFQQGAGGSVPATLENDPEGPRKGYGGGEAEGKWMYVYVPYVKFGYAGDLEGKRERPRSDAWGVG